MNRFKSKKKAPKEESADTRPSLESENSFSLFRRGKKQQEPEPKKELDLASALPSNDDFRTSLLMNGLSARFSMLREQDDPNSKIGKASDDSVLFPKRQSRLADFGFGSGLGDIAEVESFKAPAFQRKDSNASYDSSMMTRSRPMETNVLFGGRQKIFKVATGKNAGDSLGGRVLYDGDMASSSFQKWRAAEKEKEVGRLDDPEDQDDDKAPSDRGPEETSFLTRSESPVQGYNKKRETSSTTSSTPSVGRNSTAATSIMSQPTTVSKEAAQSANSTPGVDRHVTRTRKLYEQGLTQNLQEQQNSVLTRVDTLARRPGGGRTPEMGPNTPSPTNQHFNDRWAAVGTERRTISSKGSAPNLRSATSPPATGSLNAKTTLDTSVATSATDALFASPPLSPPISDADTGEHVNLDIQANDLGKATAMNVFQKPTSPYDESKHTARMRQLQQGRGTPIQRFRDEANFTFPATRAQSPISARKEESDIKTTIISAPKKAESPAQRDTPNRYTFHDSNLESPILNEHVHDPQSPDIRLERPSDQDHPAFRGAAASKPLTFSAANSPLSPDPLTPDLVAVGLRPAMLADSPTLGPMTGGLSGMVRQHLRTESDVSSIYGQSPQSSPRTYEARDALEGIDSIDARIPSVERNPPVPKPMPRMDNASFGNSFGSQSPRSPDEEAEFAGQLAEARRRVREKLTSFVETDTTHSSPTMLADQGADLPPLPFRSNPLGTLKDKSSRGSLVDRSRDAAKIVKEPRSEDVTEARLNEEEDAHPSLRAFRQARREVQKRKESERSHMASPPMGEHSHMAHGGRREVSRTPSGDRAPQSASRQPRQMTGAIPENMPSPHPRSRSRQRRDRSGSERSDESNPSRRRPLPQLQDQVPAHDGQLKPSEMHHGQASRRPMVRSPGLPGMDVRTLPFVPPVHPRSDRRPAAPRLVTGGFNDAANLKGLPGRAMTAPLHSAPFPNSPRNGRFEQPRALYPHNSASTSAPGSAPCTPISQLSARPSFPHSTYSPTTGSTLTDAMKRTVNKKDISEPTFMMSTSRVPTTNLPQDARGTRSRSGSIAEPCSPPPVPLVNPRRRRDSSKTRTLMNGNFGGRRSDEADSAAFSRSTPQLPLANSSAASSASPVDHEHNSVPAAAVEDVRTSRRRLRKSSSELGMDRRTKSKTRRVSPPQVAIGPSAGRAVMTRGEPSPNMHGGMF